MEELRLHYPSILKGDSLFQEYHSVDFQRPGHERYQRTLRDIQRLQGRLHANTKFDRLVRWGAANLFWVVADPGIIVGHELPAGWGLLLHRGDGLEVAVKPLLHEVSESERLALMKSADRAPQKLKNRGGQQKLGVRVQNLTEMLDAKSTPFGRQRVSQNTAWGGALPARRILVSARDEGLARWPGST